MRVVEPRVGEPEKEEICQECSDGLDTSGDMMTHAEEYHEAPISVWEDVEHNSRKPKETKED